MIAGKLDEARVREIIAESVKPPVHEIVVKTPDMPEGVNVGRQHKQFEELLIACNARTAKGRLNVWITGAAGTGKTTAAEMVAKALDLEFASTGSLAEIYKVMGHRSPGTGEYVATHFRRIWENGGVFLFDDFDASDPSAVIEMNQPLANCLCAFEDGMVRRHPDTVIILTANTWGHGATDDYCGRLKQDKAFLDRFVQIDWEIDEDLERETCSNLAWVEVVQRIRANVKRQGMKVLVTPRASYHGAALLEAGLPMDKVARMTIRKGMTDQQWSSVC
jgi:MoxR-like ATPase